MGGGDGGAGGARADARGRARSAGHSRSPAKHHALCREAVNYVAMPIKNFGKESIRLVKRCTKPDRREFNKIAIRTGGGFIVMGFIGFFVKLLFIPVNNIIVGG